MKILDVWSYPQKWISYTYYDKFCGKHKSIKWGIRKYIYSWQQKRNKNKL